MLWVSEIILLLFPLFNHCLWCWKRLLRVLWTARRSNQSILKEISPEYSFIGRTDAEAEAPILWLPHVKNWLIGKDTGLGKIEGRRRGWQRMRWFDGIATWWTWVWASSESGWWTGKLGVLQSMGSQRMGHDWVIELKRTELNWVYCICTERWHHL